MKRFAFSSLGVLVLTGMCGPFLAAREPIRFGRTPDLSPDGKQIAFSYRGDIWIVPAAGGVARPLTDHVGHSFLPRFSPDGRSIAFSSNRYGNYDVFVVAAEGGQLRRLTFDTASDLANSWTPDGREVLFTSTRSLDYPPASDLYTIPVGGGRVRRIGVAEGREGVFSPTGERIAYVRGPGAWYRKGYRGSANDDIWVCQKDGSVPFRLTTFLGQDTSPMWSADGRSIYYVSEYFGNPANIVRQNADGRSAPEQVTFHREDGVRQARISRNGSAIVYECAADLRILSTSTGESRCVSIEVPAEDPVNSACKICLDHEASEFSVSPDDRDVAFVVHGQIFLMPLAGGEARRITDGSAVNHGLAWSGDAKRLVYVSDKNGTDQLYIVEGDEAGNGLGASRRLHSRRLSADPIAASGPSFSPDRRRIAFLRGGKLWTIQTDGADARIVSNEVEVFDYDWSPDSKWLVYARQDGSCASELYLIPAEGRGTPVNITRYATYNGDVNWSADGSRIAFISQRPHELSLYVLSLQKPAAPDLPLSGGMDIDWEDIHFRVKQPARMLVEEGAISADGRRVAFRAGGEGGEDLWTADSDGGHLTRLTSGNVRPQQIQWSRLKPERIYFRDGDGRLRRACLGTQSEAEIIPFRAHLTIPRHAEFAEIFQQSWRALRENFYDPSFHGTDWDAVRSKYAPLLRHVTMKEDLFALISLMMGELNASHLAITSPASPAADATADLGILFDPRAPGSGLRVREIVKRGPADCRGMTLSVGDTICSIDGVELGPDVNLSQLLNGKVGETVTLEIRPRSAGHERRFVRLKATSREDIAALMYERWVERNARRVAELSGGRLGYIHIPSMDDEGTDRFLRTLYSDNFDKDALVLDVRYNGGGFTHDQVLDYLCGKEHTFFRQRCGTAGCVMRPLDRRWTKPLVLLINNRSFSDAEIFPSAFRALGLGPLVGQPTPGHVIGTTMVRLVDGSTLQVPRTGIYTATGDDMEGQGIVPDVIVEPTPDEICQGKDSQLERAVEILSRQALAWRRTHPAKTFRPGRAAAAASVAGTAADSSAGER